MESIMYYKQTPILKRILEYIDNSVYIKGLNPKIENASARRYSDIMHAVTEGSDIYRSLIDLSNINLYIDIEYGNKNYPGEIFHNPKQTFEKLEPLRLKVKEFLDKNGLNYVELMTGQGYNFITGIKRDSPSYKALVKIGKDLKVLPWSAAERLIVKERKYGNIPLLKDGFAFGALGKISDHIYSELKNKDIGLKLKTTDLFDDNEIAIFDTSQYGYLLYRRYHRVAFSLHQKSKMKPELKYFGPAIATIPTKGLSLNNRLDIRSDDSNNYAKVVELAKESNAHIPKTDVSLLITNYLFSQSFTKHKNQAQQFDQINLNDQQIKLLQDAYYGEDYNNIFWTLPKYPDWNKINKSIKSSVFRKIIDYPNDLMLNPNNLNIIINELQNIGLPETQMISLIAQKYSETQHNWNTDLTKNDPLLRAEYWVSTLKNQ